MRIWEGTGSATSCVVLFLVVAVSLGVSASSGLGADSTPRSDELSLLAYTNLARVQHGLPILVWNPDLGRAARAHSDDQAAHEGRCGHDSCSGTAWWRRVQSYYPGWIALGENIASNAPNARWLHEGWMDSPGHRANILSPAYTEFGAGISIGQTNIGSWAYATEDFGSRGAIDPNTVPTLVAGGISPRIGYNDPRELIVNYYHPGGGAPKAVRALVGTSCVNLPKMSGSATNGTYGVNRTFTGSGCVPVVFEAIRSDNVKVRWPKDDAVLIGVGAGGYYCAERTTAVPTQDCGGGGSPPAPTPTPAPAPTPTPNGSELSKVRVVLKPGQRDASKGLVQIQATLPSVAGFDPASGGVSLRLSIGQSGDWSESLPQTCGSAPCLKPNTRGTVYRAKYAPNLTLNLTQAKDGRWKLRYASRNETLAGLSPGTVRLTVTIGGRTFVGSAAGELKQQGLVAD